MNYVNESVQINQTTKGREMNNQIIALTGAAGAGKDTVADHLARRGFEKVSFAAALKSALAIITRDEKFTAGTRQDKEDICPALGMTRRAAMQVFGQEMRNIFGLDVWTKGVKSDLSRADKAVITDCRYDNEARMLKESGAVIVRIVRPDNKNALTGPEAEHDSEKPIDEAFVDVEITNDGTVDELFQEVDRLVLAYFKEGRE